MVSDPRQFVSKLPIVPDDERRVLLDWSHAAPGCEEDACVENLIGAQVLRTPSAVAVVDGIRQLTYGELEGQANHLARWLRQRGVGRGHRVGLMLERSAELTPDAARRAPDGWRIANIGAVATTAPAAAPAYGYTPAPTGVTLWVLYRK